MKLSYKQIAVFGQVRVNIRPLDSIGNEYITLLDLYKQGFWVTQRFGTIITVVKPRAHIKDGFSCVCRRIDTTINLNTLDALTEEIAEKQYQRYKDYLESKKGWSKTVRGNDVKNKMPLLQPDNRS